MLRVSRFSDNPGSFTKRESHSTLKRSYVEVHFDLESSNNMKLHGSSCECLTNLYYSSLRASCECKFVLKYLFGMTASENYLS